MDPIASRMACAAGAPLFKPSTVPSPHHHTHHRTAGVNFELRARFKPFTSAPATEPGRDRAAWPQRAVVPKWQLGNLASKSHLENIAQ